MVGDRNIKRVRGFLYWEPMLADFKKAELAKVRPPKKIYGRRVPADLSGLTFEQLVRLWDIEDTRSLFLESAKVILGFPEQLTLALPTMPVLGFVNMVSQELVKIKSAFGQCGDINPPTPQEIRAGCSELDFGVFGIADWYAQRMGIRDHDEVFKTKWTRIYQCMRNDALVAAYRRRLDEIRMEELKIQR